MRVKTEIVMEALMSIAKRLCVSVALCITGISVYASGSGGCCAASGSYVCYQKGLFALDLGVGSNIDLSSLSKEQKEVFYERPRSVFQISMRPSYYFSRHWGGYLDLRFNLFRFHEIERLLDVLMPGLSKLKPTLSLGGTYRYERGPWQLQPRLGVGIVDYGGGNKHVKHNGKETAQKRSGSMWSVDAGVSVAYRTSRICAIFLDINTMQPFTPAKYTKTVTVDGTTTRYRVESHTWGRSMSLSLGLRLQTF